MTIRKLTRRFAAVMFTLSATLGIASHADAYDVYRRVAANAVTGAVVWNAANFGVGGAVPTLSFFHYANDGAAQAGMPLAQCFVKVNLPNTVPAPLPLVQDIVGNAIIPVNGAIGDLPRLFPWNIIFDNVPPGHWSIPRTEITTGNTNNPASRVAAAGFHSLAMTPGAGVTVVNGNLANCHA